MTPYQLIRKGYYIFPLGARRKPVISWRSASSINPHDIEAWTKKFPGCGWGIDCGRSGLLVVDDDRGKKPEAVRSLYELERANGDIPETFTVKTRTGGFHYYFRGQGRNTSDTVLGKGLDSRGDGGFVVAPGTAGYTVIEDGPVAPAPEWLSRLLAAPARRELPEDVDIELNKPEAIVRAIKFLETAEIAVEGEGGDTTTFRVAARVKDFGISEDVCIDLMDEYWDHRCEPPWGSELAGKVGNVYRYAGSATGHAAPEAAFGAWEDPDEKGPKERKSWFVEANALLLTEIRVNYLVHGKIETPSTGLLFGDPSAGKSFLAIDLALSVACGSDWFGSFSKQGIAIYFAGEGRHGVQRRMKAWVEYHGAEIPENHFFVSDRRIEFTPKALKVAAADMVEIQKKAGKPIALVVIDTLARHVAPGADENSAKDMGEFINAVDAMRDTFNCVALVVHHSGKMAKNASRGSSAIRGAMDWEAKVKVEDKRGNRSLAFTKQKESELPPPFGFRLEEVDVGGDVTSAVPILCEFNAAKETADNLGTDASLLLTVLQFTAGAGSCEEKDWREAFYDTLGDQYGAATKRQKFGRGKRKLEAAGLLSWDGTKVMIDFEREAELKGRDDE